MNRKLVGLCILVLAAASVAMAHGDKKHVIGTVEKISGDSIVVKTKTGQSVEVKLASSTMYVSRVGTEDKPAKMSDVAVGDRVVIHATPNGETLTADEVKFSPAGQSNTVGKPKQ